MFVVMAAGASEAEVLGVKSHILAEGLTPFDHQVPIASSSRSSARWAAASRPCSRARRATRGRAGDADQPAVQAHVARVPPGGHRHPRARRGDRRWVLDRDGGPLLGREP